MLSGAHTCCSAHIYRYNPILDAYHSKIRGCAVAEISDQYLGRPESLPTPYPTKKLFESDHAKVSDVVRDLRNFSATKRVCLHGI